MITTGSWEIAIYPHCPVKFTPKDIKFIYFIIFNEDILQCEIVITNKENFTFIHPKIKPLAPIIIVLTINVALPIEILEYLDNI